MQRGGSLQNRLLLPQVVHQHLRDPLDRAFFLEGYLFIALVYFVCCYSMSRYSRWVETRLNIGTRRN